MGVVDTSQNFNSTDTITSAKLNNIIDDTFFTSTAISGSTLQIVSPGKLAVAAGGITANELASGAVTPAKISTGGPSWTASSVTIPSNTSVSGTVTATGFVGPLTGNVTGSAITSGTSVTASGTSVDFTSVPSWVKKITIMFSGVSTSGTSVPIIQLGDSGGIETTSYNSTGSRIAGSTAASSAFTNGLGIGSANISSATIHGSVVITLITGNTWTAFGVLSDSSNTYSLFCSGGKSLSDALITVRITTVNGTDTFDAGTINVMYE